jgi:hypothetical protein
VLDRWKNGALFSEIQVLATPAFQTSITPSKVYLGMQLRGWNPFFLKQVHRFPDHAKIAAKKANGVFIKFIRFDVVSNPSLKIPFFITA